jgi:hypothetical protein
MRVRPPRSRSQISASPEDPSIKVSSPAIALATAVLFVSLAPGGSHGRQTAPAGPPAASQKTDRAKAPGVQDRDPSNRQRRTAGPFMVGRHRRGPDDPEWTPGPVPETIPVSLSGQARDEEGRPVPRARVLLFSTGILEPKRAGLRPRTQRVGIGSRAVGSRWSASTRQDPAAEGDHALRS